MNILVRPYRTVLDWAFGGVLSWWHVSCAIWGSELSEILPKNGEANGKEHGNWSGSSGHMVGKAQVITR